MAPSPNLLGPQRFSVTLRRTFNLTDRRPGDRVRLRLPLPLEDSALGDLQSRYLAPADMALPAAVGPARLDAMVEVPACGEVAMGINATFTALPLLTATSLLDLNRTEVELYTRPNEGLIKVSDKVAALATKLASKECDPIEIMRRYWAFMLDEFSFGVLHHDELDPARPVDWALEHGWYDCQVGSAFLVALCRARGLPARMVSGYTLYPTAPGFHSWLEVWIEGRGWVPFDLVNWDLSAGGRDEGWRDYFFGQIDHRMVVHRPPRLFSGPGSVRLPDAWHLLVALEESGTTIALHAVDTGALVFRDHIEVKRLD